MYKYKEFPRTVYGPDGASKTINSEDERPDGWVNSPKELVEGAKDAAVKASKAAKAADTRLRNGYMKLLDEHKVVYDKDLGTDKLGALVEKLQAHLASKQSNPQGGDQTPTTTQVGTNGNGQ